MRHQLITEEFVHLFQSLAFSLWVKEPITQEGDNVEAEEDVEILELYGAQCLRRELGEDEVHNPVCECRDGITKGAAFDREDLCGVNPGYNTERCV